MYQGHHSFNGFSSGAVHCWWAEPPKGLVTRFFADLSVTFELKLTAAVVGFYPDIVT